MKKTLRKEIIQRRMLIPQEEITKKSKAIVEKLFAQHFFQQAEVVMTYLDFRNEVQTGDVVENCWQRGKRVIIPVCQKETITILPAEIKSSADLCQGTWGILEPKQECLRPVKAGIIDLVLVPGVAFDTDGNRLGYGAGYYDRFLPLLRENAVTAALAFEEQILTDVFPEDHDRPVDWIITPSRLIKCS